MAVCIGRPLFTGDKPEDKAIRQNFKNKCSNRYFRSSIPNFHPLIVAIFTSGVFNNDVRIT